MKLINITDKVCNQIDNVERNQIHDRVWGQAQHPSWDRVSRTTRNQINNQCCQQVHNHVWTLIGDRIFDHVRDRNWSYHNYETD